MKHHPRAQVYKLPRSIYIVLCLAVIANIVATVIVLKYFTI